MTDTQQKESAPEVLGKAPSPAQSIRQIAISLVLLGIIFGWVIPSFASYSDIWDAMSSLSAEALLALVVVTVVLEVTKSMIPAGLVEQLSYRRSFIADEASNAISNIVPGPSGTTTR